MSRPFLSEPFVTQQSAVINYVTDPRNTSHLNTDENVSVPSSPGLVCSYIKSKLGKFNNINVEQELFSEICYHIILIEFDIECEKRDETSDILKYSPPAFVNVMNINHVFKRKLTVKGEFITNQSPDAKILPIKKSVMLCPGEIDSLHSHRFSYYDINYRVVYEIHI